MTPEQKASRDRIIALSLKLGVVLDELAEDIEDGAARDPTLWTPFDVRRTTLDLRTAARIVQGVTEKLKQVGTWKKEGG